MQHADLAHGTSRYVGDEGTEMKHRTARRSSVCLEHKGSEPREGDRKGG